MKISNIILFGLINNGEGRKTPYERRLIKTFNILGTWAQVHLVGNEHYTEKLVEKQNKV